MNGTNPRRFPTDGRSSHRFRAWLMAAAGVALVAAPAGGLMVRSTESCVDVGGSHILGTGISARVNKCVDPCARCPATPPPAVTDSRDQ